MTTCWCMESLSPMDGQPAIPSYSLAEGGELSRYGSARLCDSAATRIVYQMLNCPNDQDRDKNAGRSLPELCVSTRRQWSLARRARLYGWPWNSPRDVGDRRGADGSRIFRTAARPILPVRILRTDGSACRVHGSRAAKGLDGEIFRARNASQHHG